MVFFKSAFRGNRKAVTQPPYLLQSNFLEFVWGIRPMETVPVKTLHQNPETGSIPLQDFDGSASAIAECKHTSRIGIQVKFQFDDSSKSMVTLP